MSVKDVRRRIAEIYGNVEPAKEPVKEDGDAPAEGDGEAVMKESTEATEAEARAAGRKLSNSLHWDGYLILIAAGEALEDANFHKEAAAVRAMAEKL